MNKANLHIVIGLGATGLSCVRFLTQHQIPVIVKDTRESPPNLEKFRQKYPQVPVYTGDSWPAELETAQQLIVSPGISIATPAIARAQAAGVEVIGDVELFARYNRAPVIAITGSNGKSTVTTLVGEMACIAGKKVAVVGNIGTPVLDMLTHKADADLIIMELSSFQLETTSSLQPLVATVLNITPDHLDRYTSFADYVAAKHRIYYQATHAIINKEDPLSASDQITGQQHFFGLQAPLAGEFGIREYQGQMWLAYGSANLLPTKALKIFGQHNIANALSALALGHAAGLEMQAMLQALQNFSGLAHRCQTIAQQNNIAWINDSKGTNVGACQSALQGIGADLAGKVVLLLGGDGKGADFTPLTALVSQYCRAIIVMGKDQDAILATLGQTVPAHRAANMQQAVELALACAHPQDVVLLSPACASLDQYRDYAHRGEFFTHCVNTCLGLVNHAIG